MKKLSNYFAYAICLIAMSFSTGAFTNAYANNLPGQPVDLTYAAEKALPAVVHIKYLQNSKIQTVDVQDDPFGDFFDPFGFLVIRETGALRKERFRHQSVKVRVRVL